MLLNPLNLSLKSHNLQQLKKSSINLSNIYDRITFTPSSAWGFTWCEVWWRFSRLFLTLLGLRFDLGISLGFWLNLGLQLSFLLNLGISVRSSSPYSSHPPPTPINQNHLLNPLWKHIKKSAPISQNPFLNPSIRTLKFSKSH